MLINHTPFVSFCKQDSPFAKQFETNRVLNIATLIQLKNFTERCTNTELHSVIINAESSPDCDFLIFHFLFQLLIILEEKPTRLNVTEEQVAFTLKSKFQMKGFFTHKFLAMTAGLYNIQLPVRLPIAIDEYHIFLKELMYLDDFVKASPTILNEITFLNKYLHAVTGYTDILSYPSRSGSLLIWGHSLSKIIQATCDYIHTYSEEKPEQQWLVDKNRAMLNAFKNSLMASPRDSKQETLFKNLNEKFRAVIAAHCEDSCLAEIDLTPGNVRNLTPSQVAYRANLQSIPTLVGLADCIAQYLQRSNPNRSNCNPNILQRDITLSWLQVILTATPNPEFTGTWEEHLFHLMMASCNPTLMYNDHHGRPCLDSWLGKTFTRTAQAMICKTRLYFLNNILNHEISHLDPNEAMARLHRVKTNVIFCRHTSSFWGGGFGRTEPLCIADKKIASIQKTSHVPMRNQRS